MKKILNVVLDYILPTALVFTTVLVFLKSSMSGFYNFTYLIAGTLFGGLLIYQSLKERNKAKKTLKLSFEASVSDSKDSVNLPETLPLESNNNITNNINELVGICYRASFNGGWHTDRFTGMLLDRNKAEMLCLIHSEISEAMEGERKGLMDDHLPERPMAEVELADAVIRIADYCGRWGYDLGGAIVEKLAYNATRADHRPENRAQEGGKKF